MSHLYYLSIEVLITTSISQRTLKPKLTLDHSPDHNTRNTEDEVAKAVKI